MTPEKGHTMNDQTSSQPSPHAAPAAPADPLQSDPARVARYAEAICRTEAIWPAMVDAPEVVQAEYLKEARAVAAVADEERAALVAEVERLRGLNDFIGTEHLRLEESYSVQVGLLEDAEAECGELRTRVAEVEALRSKLAKVEALAPQIIQFLDEIAKRTYVPGKPRGWDSQNAWANARCLETALADAPAEQRAEGGA